MRVVRKLFFFVPFLLQACAIQVPPGGGEKDVLPPKLLSSEPENFSTLFKGNDIRLDFDEYIALNELSTQLIVSPLLKYPPEVQVRKKSLLIHIKDTLIENTTYTMNFGKSIMDNNEGNKLENFQFVFSTGTIIDSLFIKGKIVRAFNLDTEKGILAMLYKDNSDSVPFLERPIYFSRTNEAGEFVIQNISPDKYKIVALKDGDGNYLYTPEIEMIGYSDTLIPSNSENVNFAFFKETIKPRLLKAYSEFSGKIVFAFNSSADLIRYDWISDTSRLNIYSINYSPKRDTMNLWYTNLTADSLGVVFHTDTVSDTLTLRLFKGMTESRGKKSHELTFTPGSNQSVRQHLYQPFYLQSNHPLTSVDFTELIMKEDTVRIVPEMKFSDSLRTLISIHHAWKSKTSYSLVVPKSVCKDIFGLSNDTLQISFSTYSETDYGSIKFNYSMNDPQQCIIQLVDVPGDNVFSEVKAANDTTVEFNFLNPGTYRIKFIQDRNKNGLWDTGNYLKQLQPESVDFYPENITVRSNWDVELSFKPVFKEK